MSIASEAFELPMAITALTICIAAGRLWPRFFADLLWQTLISPRIVVPVSAVVLILLDLPLNLMFALSALSPLGFSIVLIVAPALISVMSDLAAYTIARARGQAGELGWRRYIFEARSRAQRDTYEAPRNER